MTVTFFFFFFVGPDGSPALPHDASALNAPTLGWTFFLFFFYRVSLCFHWISKSGRAFDFVFCVYAGENECYLVWLELDGTVLVFSWLACFDLALLCVSIGWPSWGSCQVIDLVLSGSRCLLFGSRLVTVGLPSFLISFSSGALWVGTRFYLVLLGFGTSLASSSGSADPLERWRIRKRKHPRRTKIFTGKQNGRGGGRREEEKNSERQHKMKKKWWEKKNPNELPPRRLVEGFAAVSTNKQAKPNPVESSLPNFKPSKPSKTK